MKNPLPGFNLEYSPHPSIVYRAPEGKDPFSIRLFLRGPAMDQALGLPSNSRELVAHDFPRQGPLIAPKQVHGTKIIRFEESTTLPERPEGDGVLLTSKDVEGSLRFADCFPIILASLKPAPWIALLHSGYRGVVRGIAGKACEELFTVGGADPSETWAWIGPGIGKNHYSRKNDDPWTQRGRKVFSHENMVEQGELVFFDLGGEIRRQLTANAINDEMICSIPLCTFENNDVCYSYRRGDKNGRLFLLAWLN